MSWCRLLATGNMKHVPVCTGMYEYVLVHTAACTPLYHVMAPSIYHGQYVVCTRMYWYVRVVPVHNGMYLYVLVCTYRVLDIVRNVQANSKQSRECVCLDIKLLEPSRIELQGQDPAPPPALPHGHPSSSSPDWLEYIYCVCLAGNSTPTIPHMFSKHKGSGFPIGSTDTAAADGRRRKAALHFLKFDVILSYHLHRSCTLFHLTLRALPGCRRYLRVLSQACTSTY
jgi:hypothetical protein